MRVIADFIFVILFFVLLIGWLLAWAAFHITGGAIHLLLIIAAVSLIIHFFRGRSVV
ncbi:MAG TPA: lmo0937 family membrane protein [Bryobacteraceae bacterium]|nr:lmo0937 family membrane protein [Bryobacteraceae bacterium]